MISRGARGLVYVTSGFMLSMWALISWHGSGYVFGGKYTADGRDGGFLILVALVGCLAIVGGLFEIVISRTKQRAPDVHDEQLPDQ